MNPLQPDFMVWEDQHRSNPTPDCVPWPRLLIEREIRFERFLRFKTRKTHALAHSLEAGGKHGAGRGEGRRDNKQRGAGRSTHMWWTTLFKTRPSDRVCYPTTSRRPIILFRKSMSRGLNAPPLAQNVGPRRHASLLPTAQRFPQSP